VEPELRETERDEAMGFNNKKKIYIKKKEGKIME
jgi:hypothetical protein